MNKPTPITKEYVKYLFNLNEKEIEQLKIKELLTEEEQKYCKEMIPVIIGEMTPEEFTKALDNM